MRSVDLTPFYGSIVGLDRVSRLLDAATRTDAGAAGYPPYNIEETGENAYRIELAVAGFKESELSIEVKESTLAIVGEKSAEDGKRYLHRGIAARAFERRFQLADHVVVKGARLEHGLLVIELAREIPESAKPRKIAIASENGAKTIEGVAS